MKKLALALLAATLFVPAAARAQFVNIRLPLPPAPPLVLIAPDIQVVENHDEEVFFHDGHYWTRREGNWYRSRHADREFVYIEHRHVPPGLVRITPGHYRHYRHERHEVREERREDRREQHLRQDERRLREDERRLQAEERRLRENERRQREEEERRRKHHREERRDDRRETHGTPTTGHSKPPPPGTHEATPAPEHHR